MEDSEVKNKLKNEDFLVQQVIEWHNSILPDVDEDEVSSFFKNGKYCLFRRYESGEWLIEVAKYIVNRKAHEVDIEETQSMVEEVTEAEEEDEEEENDEMEGDVKTKRSPRRKISKELRRQVWRQNHLEGQCYICESTLWFDDAHCGHVVPHANGGSATLDNLVAICANCNNQMSKKDFQICMNNWREQLGLKVKELPWNQASSHTHEVHDDA
ncbi:Aste57867_19668 [Aphanomyces stellatus]|nr:hypothetical protein As57867_019603 [Aphanomyces stellatus]VFT96368.1 Aste57867_19668 [Aphanomyces stellatus]